MPRDCHKVISLTAVIVAPTSVACVLLVAGCAESGANSSKKEAASTACSHRNCTACSIRNQTEVFRRSELASLLVHRALRSNQRLLNFLQRLRNSDCRQGQIWELLGCIHTQQQFLARLAADPRPGQLIRFDWLYWCLLTIENF